MSPVLFLVEGMNHKIRDVLDILLCNLINVGDY